MPKEIFWETESRNEYEGPVQLVRGFLGDGLMLIQEQSGLTMTMDIRPEEIEGLRDALTAFIEADGGANDGPDQTG